MSYCQLTLEDIGSCADELKTFHQNYEPFFSTPNAYDWSLKYLHSTFVFSNRRNIANRAGAIPGGNVQNIHHFISNADWYDQPVIRQIQQDVNDLIGDANQGVLIVDESGIPKKGTVSVGVARQYCGATGKTDNCQVGVFLAYCSETNCTLIDRRLYLPEEWFSSQKRLQEAGVPKEVTFQTKGQLALWMIKQAIEDGISFSFISGDATYGNTPWFRDALEDISQVYFLEISCDTQVWLSRPKTEIPKRRSKKGRPPTRERLVGEKKPQRVDQIAASIDEEKWTHIFVREGEKGPLEWEFCALRVVTVRSGLPGLDEWLIIRRSLDKKELKFAFSNADENTPLEVHAERFSRRYWVERSIQIGKGATGLDEYEVRGWKGWHHHMTMTLLSMLFLLQLRIKLQPKAPRLTIEDVRDILDVVLPKRELSYQEAIELIEEKHRARAASKKSHHRRYNTKNKANQRRASPE